MTIDTRRNRMAVKLANAALRIADRRYRQRLRALIARGLASEAADCTCTPEYPDEPACSVHGYFPSPPIKRIPIESLGGIWTNEDGTPWFTTGEWLDARHGETGDADG